jgi:hypothetical protein
VVTVSLLLLSFLQELAKASPKTQIMASFFIVKGFSGAYL